MQRAGDVGGHLDGMLDVAGGCDAPGRRGAAVAG